MRLYFAYIRVSTVKQGEHGSSLHEQRDAISNFARRNGITISNWFEERETAAKTGRHEFTRMVAALKKGKAQGVIFHKIDRSARNLKDWSAVQDLADLGIDVRFTQESINLGSNEGKLTGDFLAVISSHYIRNLREEVRKGIRGRLKQGLYPFNAHVGYLNMGGGRPKVPDPERAPFIRLAFELYATGTYSIPMLSDELFARGFRSASSKPLGVNRIAEILRNPFYVGIIHIKRTGETYAGVHEPIIPKTLFDQVQAALDGRVAKRPLVHEFLFRRIVRCKNCHYSLIGETQKGHVYYRCHTRACPPCCVRQEVIEAAIADRFAVLTLLENETVDLKRRAHRYASNRQDLRDQKIQSIKLQLEHISARTTRLMDVFLDGTIERPDFEEKKHALLLERQGLEEELARIQDDALYLQSQIEKYLEPLQNLVSGYEKGNPDQKRRLMKTVTSNLVADGKNLSIELKNPFQDIAELDLLRSGAPHRGTPRTVILGKIFNMIVRHCDAETKERVRQPHELRPLA